ncbi:MAG: FixH family protein [Chitinophagaceae bacterium]
MNWGNKLLVTFLVFGAGMTFLVYRSVKTNYEMVETDYYKNELAYQQVIDGSNRANALTSPVTLQQTEKGILLQLPEEMKNKTVTGEVHFYCAYDEKKDKKVELKTGTDGSQLISTEKLQPGTYTVKINWQQNGESYYSEKNLTVL